MRFRKSPTPPDSNTRPEPADTATSGNGHKGPDSILLGDYGPGSTAEDVEQALVEPADLDVDRDGNRIGEILFRRRQVKKGQLVEALRQRAHSDKRIGDLLVETGATTEASLAKALAEQAGLDTIDLHELVVDGNAVPLLPEDEARKLQAIVVEMSAEGVRVAVADPSETTLERLREVIPAGVTFVVAPANDVARVINREYRAITGVTEHIQAFEAAETIREAAEKVTPDSDADHAPVVNVVNLIITQALRDRASDIHFEPQEKRLRVRFRIDGVLHDALALPIAMAAALVSRIKIMAGMNIVERRRSQDGQIALDLDGRDLDIRVSTAGTIWGEKAVLRLLDKSRPLFRLKDLGMPEDTVNVYSDLIRSPHGMVVCAGPTGSGKTTTLYASISEINQPELNIVTIEDPVEYILSSINQIQTNEQAGITFASTLRSTLRQDPDVILVGEIRDADTAHIAVRAALTGHLVLSSLHATDAAAAIFRFIDMGVEPFLVSSSLRAVVAQRLVRRVCQYCKKSYKPTADELAFYEQSDAEPKHKFVQGEGCNFCSQTGFSDRIGVYETMLLDDEIKELIVSGATRDLVRDVALKNGMRPLLQQGMDLVASDMTTISEVARSIYVI